MKSELSANAFLEMITDIQNSMCLFHLKYFWAKKCVLSLTKSWKNQKSISQPIHSIHNMWSI